MSFEALRTGCVIRYPYLWAREAARGETEGRKSRPTAVGIRLPRPDGDTLLLFPITSQPPRPDCFAVEIPEIEKRRAGLDTSLRLWIVLDEYNTDIVGQSFYLEPDPPLGQFGKPWFETVLRSVIAHKKQLHAVRRGD
ncbi:MULTISPECIES: hypothetical protein [Oceanibaculum]|uniref:PemK-like protein n=1 Tax=Oceanibaculum indicum P24 TaxID=1207063 RepID=K2JVJ0_9PROT|nr:MULTISPECIES: hypothetical protein [Oceanibaculum]EKE69185.1 hypothetical protein P24_16732 [Oceanibaculum indicum P24]MCH2393243.1 hypothetical protein [Oceanibaculum sp.]